MWPPEKQDLKDVSYQQVVDSEGRFGERLYIPPCFYKSSNKLLNLRAQEK